MVGLPRAGSDSALQLLHLVRSHDDVRVSSCPVVVIEAARSRDVLLASADHP